MKFGPISIENAEDCILAHSMEINDTRLRKGTVLNSEHISILKCAGHQSVVVAQLEDGDVHENDAATQLGRALLSSNLQLLKAEAGRANLTARYDGVCKINEQHIMHLNTVDEAITVATLAANTSVTAGQLVATIKIIPFSVHQDKLLSASKIARNHPIQVLPFQATDAVLILTHSVDSKPNKKLNEKAISTLEWRLRQRHSHLAAIKVITHDENSLSTALDAICAKHQGPIFILGVSAIVDRKDVVPSAVQKSGGVIKRLGMAVDPGNLTLVAELQGRPVIGLPGCARSPKLNGFDWVLDHVLTGQSYNEQEWAAMAVGGLLKEINSRPKHRETNTQKTALKITAAVLAGGLSRRMGKENKLLQPYKGKALIEHILCALKGTSLHRPFVVTGHQADDIKQLADQHGFPTTHCETFMTGMSETLKSAVKTAAASDGIIICLGDMPGISAQHLNLLLNAFEQSQGQHICIASHQGKRGNPVLLPKSLYADVVLLEGDQGARSLFHKHRDIIELVEVGDDAIFFDVDSPRDIDQ